MFKWVEYVVGALILLALPANAADKFPGIGRAATTAEIAAWDIDVRPDFKGLPVGSGTVAQGQEVWESRCANCHGTFGESNEVFTPIVGGTTAQDIERGRVASLTDTKQPQRTTLMKVATLSSLFDYIQRAMPWNAPRSLNADDTFAVLAFILNLAEVLPENFTLSDKNMLEVQARMPNRNGMTIAHGLWNSRGKPDVQGTACMKNCVEFVQIGSTLPDYARNAHGNLAEQNRAWGPYRGAETTRPALAGLPGKPAAHSAEHSAVPPAPTISATVTANSGMDLFTSQHCSACHAVDRRLVGPALREVSKRYQAKSGAAELLAKKIRLGGSGTWGNIAMPSHGTMKPSDIASLVDWILEGKF